jgi:hypothetical protein
MDTEARGIPAVTATTVRATAPWTSGRTKVRREAKAKQALMDRHGLTSDIVYMAKPVVPRTEPRKRNYRKASPVTVTYRTTAKDLAPVFAD